MSENNDTSPKVAVDGNDFDPFDIERSVTYSSDEEAPENNAKGITSIINKNSTTSSRHDVDQRENMLSSSNLPAIVLNSSNISIKKVSNSTESFEKNLNSNSSKDDESNNDSSDNESSSDSSSNDSSTDESSDNEPSSDLGEESDLDMNETDENNDEGTDGPPRTKNEIIDFQVPSLPQDYRIGEETKIQLVGHLSGIVEKNVLIKSLSSAEERVLSEGTVFCFEDRTPIGILFEVFGKLQAPIYSIKYNTMEEALKWNDKKGAKVYFAVPTAEYISTSMIRKMKGTDASNFNDEELPEEEQEFSDDEKEAAAKKNKKRKKKSGKMENENNEKIKKPKTVPKTLLQGNNVASVKSRLTSLPSKLSNASSSPMKPPQENNLALMQQFMSMMQQASLLNNQAAFQQQHSNYYPAREHANQFLVNNLTHSQNPSQYNYLSYPQYGSAISSQMTTTINNQQPSMSNFAISSQYDTNHGAAFQNLAQSARSDLSQFHQNQFVSAQPLNVEVKPQNKRSYQNDENASRLIAQLAATVTKNPTLAENVTQESKLKDQDDDDDYVPTL